MDDIAFICGMFCSLSIGFFIMGWLISGGSSVFVPSGAAPGGHAPRGTWPRRAVGWPWTVFDQYERGVRFRWGKAVTTETGVGIRFRVPIMEELIAVDIRDRPENIPNQVCISRDNVSIKVDGVVYWKVFQPINAVLSVSDPGAIIRNATMANLRVVIGEFTLDELLQKRELIAHRLEELLDAFSRPIGIDISRVDITDVVIPHDMQRAMAREAEAQRERRARLIRAQGEVEAVKNLSHAAHTLAKNPELLELRRLQTVGELGMEQSTLITLVLPYDYGHLGGGRAGDDKKFSDADNDAYLESLGISLDEVDVVVLDEQDVTQAAKAIEMATSPTAPPTDLPNIPVTDKPTSIDGFDLPEKL